MCEIFIKRFAIGSTKSTSTLVQVMIWSGRWNDTLVDGEESAHTIIYLQILHLSWWDISFLTI